MTLRRASKFWGLKGGGGAVAFPFDRIKNIYGTIKLNPSATNCIQVLRNSDSAPFTYGFDGDTFDEASYLSDMGASYGNPSILYDQMGHNNITSFQNIWLNDSDSDIFGLIPRRPSDNALIGPHKMDYPDLDFSTGAQYIGYVVGIKTGTTNSNSNDQHIIADSQAAPYGTFRNILRKEFGGSKFEYGGRMPSGGFGPNQGTSNYNSFEGVVSVYWDMDNSIGSGNNFRELRVNGATEHKTAVATTAGLSDLTAAFNILFSNSIGNDTKIFSLVMINERITLAELAVIESTIMSKMGI